MKRADIKAGVVYAEVSPYAKPSPVVFLEDQAATVWLEPYSRSADFAYVACRAGEKPKREEGWSGRSQGYATVTGPAELLEGLDCAAELALFKGRGRPSRAGLRFALVFSLARISGPYADAVAAHEAESEALRAKREREDAEGEARESRARSIVTALGRAGIRTRTDFAQILISLDEAERLLSLLGDAKGDGND